MNKALKHNARAPYWAILLVITALTGLSSLWVQSNDFWRGYILDITGPAWNYILIRGLYTKYADNLWTRTMTPVRTYLLFLIICFGIEVAQYFELYDATFDYWDFLAYFSLLTPFFLVDLVQSRR